MLYIENRDAKYHTILSSLSQSILKVKNSIKKENQIYFFQT